MKDIKEIIKEYLIYENTHLVKQEPIAKEFKIGKVYIYEDGRHQTTISFEGGVWFCPSYIRVIQICPVGSRIEASLVIEDMDSIIWNHKEWIETKQKATS